MSYSFDDEFSTFDVNINGTHFLLAVLRQIAPKCRFYFAGSSEMLGKWKKCLSGKPPAFILARSYGISKVCGYDLVRNYREAYGMFTLSGIRF